MATREQARRGLTIYFAVAIIVSGALEWWIITHGGLNGPARSLVFPLMYTPALACVIARLVGREGFRDVSFKWGGSAGTRASLAAWLLPVVVGFIAYGIAWATGLVDFRAPEHGQFTSIANPAARVLATIPLALTIGTLLSCLSAFGEELGWRGYMVPRLVDAEVPVADVVSGLVWCFWHVPLILWGGYAVGKYPLLSVLLFILTILPVALLYFRWRMASGSIWPTVIAHGAWNVVIQGVFDAYSTGDGAALWVGESGVLTAATMWILFAVMRRARWAGTTAP
jgi:membrane protease YdiL (CAAX protease family)